MDRGVWQAAVHGVKSPHNVVTKPHFLHNMELHLLPLLPQSSICLSIYLPEAKKTCKSVPDNQTPIYLYLKQKSTGSLSPITV